MRRFILAIGVLLAGSWAIADEPYFELSVPGRPQVLPLDDPNPRGSWGETFESWPARNPFTPDVHTGWTSYFDASTALVSPGLGGTATAARHTSDGSGLEGYELNSPDYRNRLDWGMSAKVRIDGGGTRYDFVTQDTITLLFNTRVIFEGDGRILGTRVNEERMGFDTFDTGQTWTSGLEMDIGVVVSSLDSMVSVYKDGDLLYSELDTSAALGGIAGGLGQYLTFAENAPGANATFTIDEIYLDFVPEPRAFIICALGGASLLRRRCRTMG